MKAAPPPMSCKRLPSRSAAESACVRFSIKYSTNVLATMAIAPIIIAPNMPVRNRTVSESARITKASTTTAAATSKPMISCHFLLDLPAMPRAIIMKVNPAPPSTNMPIARSACTVVSCRKQITSVMKSRSGVQGEHAQLAEARCVFFFSLICGKHRPDRQHDAERAHATMAMTGRSPGDVQVRIAWP